MITQLTLHNYRSLGRQVPLTLGPLTALVGVQGSGKSNVCDALGFISECLRDGLEEAVSRRNGIDSLIRRDDEKPLDLSLSAFVRSERGSGYWEFRLSRDEDGSPFVKVETALWQPSDQKRIHTFKVTDGEWASRLKSLNPSLDRKVLTFPLVAEDPRFQDLAHELRHVAIDPDLPERLREQLQSLGPSGSKPEPLATPRLTLMGLEEPERLVPPAALPLLPDFLRQLSRQGQVLFTTRSPELLELLDVDEVRVIEQQEGTTRIAPLAAHQREDVRRSLLRPPTGTQSV